jgi:hypothetical protein
MHDWHLSEVEFSEDLARAGVAVQERPQPKPVGKALAQPTLVLSLSTHVARVDMPPGTSRRLVQAVDSLVEQAANATDLGYTLGIQGSDIELLRIHRLGARAIEKIISSGTINIFNETQTANHPFIAPQLLEDQLYFGTRAVHEAGLTPQLSCVGMVPLHAVNALATIYTDTNGKRVTLRGLHQIKNNDWEYLLIAPRNLPRGLLGEHDTEFEHTVIRVKQGADEQTVIVADPRQRKLYMQVLQKEITPSEGAKRMAALAQESFEKGEPCSVLHAPLEEGVLDQERMTLFVALMQELQKIHNSKATYITGFDSKVLSAIRKYESDNTLHQYRLTPSDTEVYLKTDPWFIQVTQMVDRWNHFTHQQKKAGLLALDTSYRYAARKRGHVKDCEGQKAEVDHILHALLYADSRKQVRLSDLSDVPREHRTPVLYKRMKALEGTLNL